MVSKRSILSAAILISFLFTTIIPANRVFALESTLLTLPKPGTMVAVSQPLVPVMLKGLQINPKDPLIVDFLVSKGDEVLGQAQYYKEIETLARYFLASMAIPEDQLWVNLSPFEKDKIITDPLSQTEMGQNMLAQDYLLKQLTASMIYPEKSLGKEFWSRIYEQAKSKTGHANIPVNTFNKVWILADTANAVEKGNTVMITDAHLKVMLEEDYLAAKKHDVVSNNENSKIIRELIIPELEREVNQGKNFAPLRQIFNAFVLSVWYKQNLKQSILNQVYTDKTKLGGIEAKDSQAKQKIYERYIEAYKKGVFNYIREDKTQTGVAQPRKYFSGGAVVTSKNINLSRDPAMFAEALKKPLDVARVSFDVQADRAMSTVGGNEKSVLQNTNTRHINGIDDFLENNDPKDVTSHYITDEVKNNLEGLVNPDFLDSALEDSVRIMLVPNGFLKHGFAIDKGLNRIYIDHSLQKKIDVKRSNIDYHDRLFHFIERKMIFINNADENKGRELEYEYVRKNPLLYELMKGLFPPNAKMPDELKKDVEEMLLGIKYEKQLAAADLKPIVHDIIGNDPREYKIVAPTENDKRVNREVYELALRSYDILALNALDGVADYHHPLPSDPSGLLRLSAPINVVEFSSKFNPVTIAQSFVTMLAVHVQSGANGYFYDISQFDPRKPEIYKSHGVRKALTRLVTDKLFGNLMTFLNLDDGNGKVSSSINLREWNGEEMFYSLIVYAVTNNHHLYGSKFSYTAGSDHFYVWAPKDGKKDSKFIQFDEMDDAVRKFYTFYVDEVAHGAASYAELIERQFALESNGARYFYGSDDTQDNKDRKKFIDAILAAKQNGVWDQKKIKEIVRASSKLPRLDTFGKLYLFQKALEKVSIVLAHTRRDLELGEDVLREEMIIKNELDVLEIESLKLNIAATNTRKALVLFLHGILDLGRLSGNTVVALKQILHVDNRGEMLDFILRQNNVILPHSIQRMTFPGSLQNLDIKEQAAKTLKSTLGEGWDIQEIETPAVVNAQGDIVEGTGVSEVRLFNTITHRFMIATYQVKNGFDKNGLPSNKLEGYKISSPRGKKFDAPKNALRAYIETINNINDKAMTIKEEQIEGFTDLKGGIELNRKDLNLKVTKEGQGLQFEIDPVLLEELKSDNFGGFRPTVLSITPLRASPALN